NGEIKEPIAVESKFFVQFFELRLKRFEAFDIRSVTGLIENKGQQTIDIRRALRLVFGFVFFQRLLDKISKRVISHGTSRHADDGVLFRHISETGKVIESRNQFLPAEIARRAEDDKCEWFLKMLSHGVVSAYTCLWYNYRL